ncbi:extensin-2-like, partial [Teleopsis dalmanni]|uniref:extensin-2-like n=1 Tax=Teleopsis dalmanni TaxID=139649 RepID=UPI0018CFDC18
NQTFVNPILSNTRPINFPSLGPFPFGRNGSLENSNGTDYFDEDDPSLYYPPAYSFVYKNNYSNPVPPGPIVPGIVLPPPPEQFSRLEKEEKITTSSPPPSTTYLPTRHRIYSTTSVPTTISTTTAIPHRQVITKISEYTPKTITITPIPTTVPTPIQTKTVVRFPPSPPPTPISSVTPPVEPVPVPVAVPVPIYPSNHYQTERPSIVSFVPTTPSSTTDTLSKSNPIYYEYVEAKRKPTTSNVIDDFLSTTNKPPVSERPVKLYPANKRPSKGQNHRHYLPANRPFIQENIVYITPKPEVRYKPPTHVTLYKPRPLENFENEVNAIRETLRYYQNQQLRDNNIPRTPKAKTVYEYSFDATKNLQPVQPIANDDFKPPTEFDDQPFQPMVTYSPPVDDENSFRAVAFDKVDSKTQEQPQPKYQTSTTLIPVEPEAQYQRTSQGRSKKLRLTAKYLEQPLVASYQRQQQQQDPRISQEFQSTPRTILTTQAPWASIDESRITDYRHPQQQREQYERVQIPYKNRFPGYYYGPPQPPIRQNNRFYDEPFQGPVRKIINYRPLLPPAQQHQQQQSPVWSLENDTYVNYAPNRPPLNPEAEFIDPYQTIPLNPYRNQGPRLPLPPLSHQSQYYAPPQRLSPSLRQQQQPHSLHRDILVNYRQPLPPLNPESEYISHPQVVRNQPQQVYRENDYRQLPNVGEQGNVYYITPKYRRAFNSNNNNNNNNNNKNNNANTGGENNGK